MSIVRSLIVVLACLALPGCYVKTYGLQTAGGGTNATVVGSQTVATTGFSNGRASFSFGQPVSPAAPGGQVTVGRGGGLVLAAGLVIADVVQVMGDWFRQGPVLARNPAPQRIAETCSCYKPEGER
jgi:hypothetical protein